VEDESTEAPNASMEAPNGVVENGLSQGQGGKHIPEMQRGEEKVRNVANKVGAGRGFEIEAGGHGSL
jgi:hypothetical protein